MGLLRSLFCKGDAGPPPDRVGDVTMTAGFSGLLRFLGGAICELATTLANRDNESPFFWPLSVASSSDFSSSCCGRGRRWSSWSSSSSSSSSLETAGVADISSEALVGELNDDNLGSMVVVVVVVTLCCGDFVAVTEAVSPPCSCC